MLLPAVTWAFLTALLALIRAILGCWDLGEDGWGPGMLLNMLQCQDAPPPQVVENYPTSNVNSPLIENTS